MTMSMQPVVSNLVLAAGDTPFVGTIYQALAAAIVFIVVLVVLKKMAWGPILTGLQDRENKIKGDLESAEAAAKDAARTLADYKAQLAHAQVEANKIIEKGRDDAERLAAQLKDQTQSEIKAIKDKATRDITSAKEQALTEIYAQVAVMSTQIAGKILKRELNAADQQAIVNESLAQLQAENN
jgi:F-type H+-transporting ATPase subunit b